MVLNLRSMIFKFVAATLSVFGLLCYAVANWPTLFNEAVNLGGYSISGALLLSFILFVGVMRLKVA